MMIFFPVIYGVAITQTLIVTPIVTPTLIVISPVQYQVIQRNEKNVGDIVVYGVYVGDLQSVEARWGPEFAWQTIDNSPSGGVFSGTLSNQPAGQYTLEVRPSNDINSVTRIDNVGIGDVFVLAGQSNADGQTANPQTYSHPTIKATMFKDGLWQELADPLGAGNGNYFILVADAVQNDQNVPVALIPTAQGSTAISSWQKGKTYYDRMISRVLAAGVSPKAVLWHQGESDAIAGTSQATYNSLLDAMANDIKSDLGCPVMACKIHNVPVDETAVNAAIAEAWEDNANVLQGPDFSDLTTSPDAYHFETDAEAITAASRWWTIMQAEWY